MSEKIYTFQCLSHGETSSGCLMFDVRYDSDVVKEMKTARCPLCGNECGQLGPWREAQGEQTSSNAWRYKWGVAIQTWERVATDLAKVKRAYEQLSTRVVEDAAKAAGAAPTMPPSSDLN